MTGFESTTFRTPSGRSIHFKYKYFLLFHPKGRLRARNEFGVGRRRYTCVFYILIFESFEVLL